jgi:hypothetical protein
MEGMGKEGGGGAGDYPGHNLHRVKRRSEWGREGDGGKGMGGGEG